MKNTQMMELPSMYQLAEDEKSLNIWCYSLYYNAPDKLNFTHLANKLCKILNQWACWK